ncbi:restriction endonuclease subunit S [Limosilactobacillus fastidiosus]|nr:restriction endonuclease subunit S [Limosilactobacillus fastidiosus]
MKDKKWFDSNSTIGWIRISDVTAQNGRIHHLSQHISKLGQQKTRVVIQPHLLLSIAASVGYPVINYIPTGVHDGFLIFNNPNFMIDYGFYWLEKYQTSWKKYGQPGSQVNLNSNIVSNTKINLPSLNEQSDIIAIFKQVSKIISLQQRKLDLLKQLKKGLLQKLFADKDAKQPVLRFDGFSGDWEQRKLGEISTSFSGGTPSVKNKSYYGGKIPFIRSAEIHKNKTELFITESGLKNSSAKLIRKGTLLYALYGATSGEVDVSNIDGAINQAIMAIFLQKDNVSFIKYYLEKNKDKIIAKYLQGGQGNLSASIIKSVYINLPFTEEQLKISNLIKKVESLISLQQSKLDKLTFLKNFLLQQMFI